MLSNAIAFLFFSGAALTPIDEPGYRELIAGHRGHVLLVSFWATWCEPCRAELPLLASMERRLPASDFRLALISIDEPEQAGNARRLWTSIRFRGRGYIGTFRNRDKFIDAVDARWSGALPALFLYDRSGLLVKTFTGQVDAREMQRAVGEVVSSVPGAMRPLSR